MQKQFYATEVYSQHNLRKIAGVCVGKKAASQNLFQLCSAVAITENEIKHKQTPRFSIISDQPQSKMHPREFSRNAVQKTEGNMNQITCTQLSVLPSFTLASQLTFSSLPTGCLWLSMLCSASLAGDEWDPPSTALENNRWALVLMFWQQVTHRKEEAALKSFTALTSTLQLSQIHIVFAISEIWSTSLIYLSEQLLHLFHSKKWNRYPSL